MEQLISSLYNCNYLDFMKCLIQLENILVNDRFFGPHASHILRELRIIAFVQYLTAYKSVSLSSMSSVFGVSADVLDRDLSNFISLSKISAKIDFEGDYIETVQNENRTVSFQEVISKGDALLTQIQKLVRLLD
jgi:26S proteasome regulatory subunit N7